MRFVLHLLGPPTLLVEGEPIGLKERKGWALLGVLGWTGEAVDRGLLADLLWSERSEAQARTSLRVLLTKLNRAAPGLLRLERTSIALSPEVEIAHRELLAAWRAAGAVAAPSELLAEPLRGPSLRGAPSYERWLEEARLQWRQELREALERIGRSAADPHERVAALRQALTLDPWHEGLHQALVEELLDAGRMVESLEHLDVLARDLFSEMGLPLSAELTALRQRALARSWEARGGDGAGASSPRFGGEAELVELLDALGDPRFSLLSVVGPPGSGTSRLLRDAAVGATGRWLHLDADGVSPAALWPRLQRALRGRPGSPPADFVAVDNLHGALELGDLIDRWFADHPQRDRPPPRLLLVLHAPTGHVRERVIRVRPLALPPHPSDAGFDEERAADSPAVRLLLYHSGANSGGATPLTVAQASEIAHWADAHPLTLLLFARAGVVALEAARKGRRPTELQVDPPPGLMERHRSLSGVLSIALRGLPEGQLMLLRALDVCQAPCSLEVLEVLAELEPSLLARLLQRLINRDLVRSEVGVDGVARFAIAGWLTWIFAAPSRTLQLRHSRVFIERARRAADEKATRQRAKLLRGMADEIADVEAALDALAVEDPLRALLVATEVAPLQRRFGYVEEALERQRRLLHAVRHRLSDEQLGDALNALGGLALFAREQPSARAAFREALELRERLGVVEKAAHTRMNLAILDALLGDAESALAGLQSALETTEAAPHSWTRAAILTNLGNAHYTLGDSVSAIAPLDAAARLFWELGDAEGSAGAALGLIANAASLSDGEKVAGAYKLIHRALAALTEGADQQLLGALRHAADRLRDSGFGDYAEDLRRLRRELEQLTAATRPVGAL